MAKKEKEVAALAAMISFLVMNATIKRHAASSGRDPGRRKRCRLMCLSGTIANVCGIQTLQMGVFGGIIVGLGVAALHNRFYKIQLPNALSFFGGSRFVPIISTITYVVCGNSDVLYLAGCAERHLCTGRTCHGHRLHRDTDFRNHQTGADSLRSAPCILSSVLADGSGRYHGSGRADRSKADRIFSLRSLRIRRQFTSAQMQPRYFSGEFIFMIFGLPGAALAMYRCAKAGEEETGGRTSPFSSAGMYADRHHRAAGIFLPVCCADAVRSSGDSGRCGLHDRPHSEYCGGTDIFRRTSGSASFSESSREMKRRAGYLIIPVGIIYFILYYCDL